MTRPPPGRACDGGAARARSAERPRGSDDGRYGRTMASMTAFVLLVYVLVPALLLFVLYLVIRRAVRDGFLDAREVDRREAALRHPPTATVQPAPVDDRP